MASQYEVERLARRYKNVKGTQKYTELEFQTNYQAWVQAEDHERLNKWDYYCDVRDQVPWGTNHKITKGEISTR